MNAIAIGYVNAHLEELRAEARQHRAASVAGPGLRDRIASGVTSLRRSLGGSIDPVVLPKLENYPYRG
jgi:hypothetical protein